MLYRFTIPIPGYERDKVFNQHLYVYARISPSKKEILEILEALDSRDKKYPEYFGCWKDAINSVNQTYEWPTLDGKLVETNTFVFIECANKNASLGVKLIRPIRIQSFIYYNPTGHNERRNTIENSTITHYL